MDVAPLEGGFRIGEIASGSREFRALSGFMTERWISNDSSEEGAPAGRIELLDNVCWPAGATGNSGDSRMKYAVSLLLGLTVGVHTVRCGPPLQSVYRRPWTVATVCEQCGSDHPSISPMCRQKALPTRTMVSRCMIHILRKYYNSGKHPFVRRAPWRPSCVTRAIGSQVSA